MSKILCVLTIGLLIVSCASAPVNTARTSASKNNNSTADAEAAAQAALAAMNDGGQRPASGNGQQTTMPRSPQAPSTAAKTGAKPTWIDAKDSVYNKSEHLSEIGMDARQDGADQKALAALTAVFGQSVEAQQKLSSAYNEAVRAGKVTTSESTSMQESIKTSTQLSTLVGASIADRWYDGKSSYYSIAVMDNAKAIQVYTSIINGYNETITTLTSISDAEKYSFDGYARYKLASIIADGNQEYVRVLTYLGATPPDVKKSADFLSEIKSIAARIPIFVNVSGDDSNRIKSALTKVITSQGLQGGTSSARYVLNVNFSLSDANFPNNPNKFARYLVEGSLIDTTNGNELLPFKLDGREGHTTIEEAKNKAIATAERKIGDAKAADSFLKKLTSYLESL
ncbi:MAG: LPP20 family lipoprotein [Treponema sp.]|jgi:hypothetical protein|nr:LPP20 family lipoprotein [Treponema sp.]